MRWKDREVTYYNELSAQAAAGLPTAIMTAVLVLAVGAGMMVYEFRRARRLLHLSPVEKMRQVAIRYQKPVAEVPPSLARFVICASCKSRVVDGHFVGCRYYRGQWRVYIPPLAALAGLVIVALFYAVNI